ncbi:MAG: hypothetical protein IJV50_07530 [Lachnospiraceae bacterium]|nr:hypothetical protein [Lachnospiraceae bacterium]
MTEVIALNKAEGREKKQSEFRYDNSSGHLPMFGVGPLMTCRGTLDGFCILSG